MCHETWPPNCQIVPFWRLFSASMLLSDVVMLANLLTGRLLDGWLISGVYGSGAVAVCGCAILSAWLVRKIPCHRLSLL